MSSANSLVGRLTTIKMASIDVMQLDEKASVYAWDDMTNKSSDYVLDDLRMHIAEHTAAQHSAPHSLPMDGPMNQSLVSLQLVSKPAHHSAPQHNASTPKICWQLVSKLVGN